MYRFKKEITEKLAAITGMETQKTAELLETPPEKEMGDLSFPCFVLAKQLQKAPAQIAEELAAKFPDSREDSYIQQVKNAGPYLNFFLQHQRLAGDVLKEIHTNTYIKKWCGVENEPVVVIDYSAPNIAKPFGIGHLRSTVIGNSLYRIYQSLGYRCVGINHLGDWGTQFGKLMSAFRHWGDETLFLADPVGYSFNLYVRFHQEVKNQPELADEARAWFKKLESGDEEAHQLWERFCRFSLNEFKRVYGILGIDFDYYQGESFYNPYLEHTLQLAREKGVAMESQGALVVELKKYGLPTCILRKSDGSTLYITRDIAAAIYRYEQFKFTKMLYVVGAEQTLHFQQLFKILELLGFTWADRCEHVPFGLIRFKEGRMSTREGNVILLQEVMERSVELAGNIVKEKNPDLPDRDGVAKAVGLGAIKFGDLYNDRIKNIDFDWDKALDFAGETAPYVQYAHARICSILRKAGLGGSGKEASATLAEKELSYGNGFMEAEEEKALLKEMALFPEVILNAVATNKPSHLARHLVELAREFNRFYHNCQVLGAAESLMENRLALIAGVQNLLAYGLELLGIEAPAEM